MGAADGVARAARRMLVSPGRGSQAGAETRGRIKITARIRRAWFLNPATSPLKDADTGVRNWAAAQWRPELHYYDILWEHWFNVKRR